MKTIRFFLAVVLCNLAFSSLALAASLKDIRLFPGLANDKNWNTFVVESTKLEKVNSQGILTDFLAEGSIPFLMNEQNELSAAWRKAINPEMLEEIKVGKYENYFQFFKKFNGFGERVPLVTLKKLVSIRNGEEGIFAPMHLPLDGEQAVEDTKKVIDNATVKVETIKPIIRPSQKPEKDIADQFGDNIFALQAKVDQLSASQGNSKEVTALKAQVNALKVQLTQLTNNQQNSTEAVQELWVGIQDLNTQLNEFSGGVSDLSLLVTSLSNGFEGKFEGLANGVQAKFAKLEGKIPSNNFWQIIVVGMLALIALIMAILAYWKKSTEGIAQAKFNNGIKKELAGVRTVADKATADVLGLSGTVSRLDGEVLGLGIANTTSLSSVSNFFINDEKSLTSKTLADLAVGKTKHVTVQVGDRKSVV